jgi:hypothetical protein
MKLLPPPLIREHDRLAHQIAAEVMRRLQAGPQGVDPMRDGLVRVFAHYAELLIGRLNRVPELHQLAFFDCLGMSASPPTPASAALLFSPVIKSGPAPIVPRHTQVAAPAAPGDTEPVVFETTAALALVCARLERAVALGRWPQQAAVIDELVAPAGLAQAMLAGATPVERAAHFGQAEVLAAPGLSRLRLQLELDQGAALPIGTVLEWGIAVDGAFIALAPRSDTTQGLTRSGELVFTDPPAWPERKIAGIASRWLTCRLRQAAGAPMAATAAISPPAGRITRLCLAGTAILEAKPPDLAFHGAAPLDTSKDFFPFGEWPRFGDVMYVRSSAFAIPRARVVLNVRLTNPAGAAEAPIPAVSLDGKPLVLWEVRTPRGWTAVVGVDDTRALTAHGLVRLTMPDDVIVTQVNAVDGGWLRARLVSGSYLAGPGPAGVAAVPALAPPAIEGITIAAEIEYGPAPADQVVLEHSFQLTVLDGAAARPFDPFPPPEVCGAALYLGLAAADNALSGRALHFFASTADTGERRVVANRSVPTVRPARWQVRGRGGWHDCVVRDESDGMRTSGFIAVSLDEDVARWADSTLDPGRRFFWLRVTWDAPDCLEPPGLGHLGLNAVPALQQATLEYELLGSGNGRPAQHLRTARMPVIGDLALEVGVPLAPARHGARHEDGIDRFSMPDTAGLPPPVTAWESWTRVDDFTASGPDDRHFILDRLTGTIMFGDGVNGRIPASGANNIRVRRYHTGGGTRGNQGAGMISQLRTTIPYVESVMNIAPSFGGRDADSVDTLRQSAAAWLRHRDRAIACDDYAELARKASPDVARASCVAAADLSSDPLGAQKTPGTVSVVIVPHGAQACPQPARGLLLQVRQYLDARCPLGVELVVSGPLYAAFHVDADIAVSPGWAPTEVAAHCEAALHRFLHPLTGGTDGAGWEFGERPHTSDFHPLLGAIEGVDHLRTLRLRATESLPGLLAGGAFLACSGAHAVRCRE